MKQNAKNTNLRSTVCLDIHDISDRKKCLDGILILSHTSSVQQSEELWTILASPVTGSYFGTYFKLSLCVEEECLQGGLVITKA
jgi:hypothetical protein